MEAQEISRLIVKINDAIKEVLKNYKTKVNIGKETGILADDSKDLILYAKIKIEKD